jgi:hypothetical protein
MSCPPVAAPGANASDPPGRPSARSSRPV